MSNWRNRPFKIDVKKGQTLTFCSCGFSQNAPYCDNSHLKRELNIKPFIIHFEKENTMFACGCRYSHNRPYCDNTHQTLKNNEAFLVGNNLGKRSSNLCLACVPYRISFIPMLEGNCVECGKKDFLMTIYNNEDEFDQEYYHDVGGEG